MNDDAQTASSQIGAIESQFERHSIDYIPKAERHGRAWHQGTFWFAANAEIATLVVGLIGISLGLSLAWTLVAIGAGLAFGSLFMASHSVQGARLGLPQMIQTRPQFGFLGALWPQAIVVFLYLGFNVFNTILAGQALATLIEIDTDVAIVVAFLASFVLAFGGYDWLHAVQRWGTVAFLIVFSIYTIGAILSVNLPDGTTVTTGGFDLPVFLIVVFATASYIISEAPYVSDYSRYLHPRESSRACFWWTYGGATLGALWMIGLGAFLLSAFPDATPAGVIQEGGDAIFDGFGTVALGLAFLMLLPVIAANMYGGSLTLITIADSIKRLRPSRRQRFLALSIIGVLATAIALAASEDFLADYTNFLAILLYLIIPWTAVNLVDYYIVRRGDYAITEIFKPNGIYGRWQWRGLLAYAVGLAAMVPFFSTAWYTGPVADSIDGADLSVFVGLPVAAVLYYVLVRGLDRASEQVIAEREDPERDLLT
jgi:NCS1 family nucleobase:cation symporter-1